MRFLTCAIVIGIVAPVAAQPVDPSAPVDAGAAAAPPDASEPPVTPPPIVDATPEPSASPEPEAAAAAPQASLPSSLEPGRIQIHGFVSGGGFVSTANNYIGESSRGSLELFEAGINASSEVADGLRVGIQLYGRAVGRFRDLPPRLDWAYLDYRWKRWLGLRAGVIKIPFGLHNEFADVDAARLPILLPQSVYLIRNRSALLAHIGFSAYGAPSLGEAGTLEYQAFLGSLDIPENALTLTGASLERIDAKYVTGAQLFWQPPVEGLRLGGSMFRLSADFELQLDPAVVAGLIGAGLAPMGFDGGIVVTQRPSQSWIGSIEYQRADWLVAAEYSRTYKRQSSTLPTVLPTTRERNERFYVQVARRLSEKLELGGYYSHTYLDPEDRGGSDTTRFSEKFHAYQRDLTATVRYDVNDHWLWKLEAHVIDGVADLEAAPNPMPKRWWGLFLFKTTVTF